MYLSEEEEDDNLSLEKFESMLKTNKVLFFDSEEFEDIILHYLDMGKSNLAKKALKLALEQHPKSTGLKLVQIEMLIYDDKLDLAEKMLNELIAIEPTNEEIYIQKANIYSKKDEHLKAIEQLEIALKYTDDLADVYNLIGMEYLFMDNLEHAKDNFKKCLEEDFEDQSALYNVVYCHEFLDQYQEAIDYLMIYIDKNPYSEIAWHQAGRLYYNLKDYSNAVRAFEYATYIDDQFVGAFLEKGKALERLKKYEDAIYNFKQTLVLDDPTSYALLRIGKCFEKLGNKKEALKYYMQTVHEDPLLDKGWQALSDFYYRQKKLDKALLYINKALEIDRENKNYWKKYGSICEILKLYDHAEHGYQKAIELDNLDLDNWMRLVDVFTKGKENGKALLTLLNISEMFLNSTQIEYRLAGVYYTMKNNIKGKHHLINALHIDIDEIQIFKNLYPEIFVSKKVQNIISKFNK